jgi:hypothetical protein
MFSNTIIFKHYVRNVFCFTYRNLLLCLETTLNMQDLDFKSMNFILNLLFNHCLHNIIVDKVCYTTLVGTRDLRTLCSPPVSLNRIHVLIFF